VDILVGLLFIVVNVEQIKVLIKMFNKQAIFDNKSSTNMKILLINNSIAIMLKLVNIFDIKNCYIIILNLNLYDL